MFSNKILTEFTEIAVFSISKVVAAFICQEMGNIPCEAVENKINVMTETNALAGFFKTYIQKDCNFTVVRHSVGYHNDIGNKGITSFF